MNNFIVEEFLVFVTDKENNRVEHYILKVDSSRVTHIVHIKNKVRKEICLEEIENKEVRDKISKVYYKVSLKTMQYANLFLLKYESNPSIPIHANVMRMEDEETEKYYFKTLRFYYNPKGRFFERVIGFKWVSTKK